MPDRRLPTLGERVKELRREQGLDQQGLAEVVKRSVSWVSQVERGEIVVSDVGMIQRLAVALSVPSRELVELGNAAEALRLAKRVDPCRLSPERRARFLVDVARAHAQRRAVALAVAALTEAETIAPGEVSDSRRVRELLDDLDHLARGRSMPGLRPLRRKATAHK